MVFRGNVEEVEPGFALNPYAGRDASGQWLPGLISIDYLDQMFGHFATATEMKSATESEGLKMYFDWLADQGKIPR